MKKIIINSILVTSLITVNGLTVFAQVKKYNSSKSNTAATEIRENVKNAVTERKSELQNKAAERKAAVQQTREELKNRVEAKKEELKTKRETQKAELKARLEKIKDGRKKAAVERLDNRFTEINAKMANHWLNALTRLEELLNKVSGRADKAEANGRDVAAVRAAVEKAKTAIAAARTALEAQLAKTYPIQITDETRLKSAVATARELLNKDLKAVREAVRAAHKAVVEATKLLKGVPKVDEEPAPAPAVQ